MFRLVPILGPARRNLALARLSLGLEALLSAGVLVVEAWQLAAAASGSPALRREVATWGPYLESGETPAEIMSRSREFPELYTSQYQSGEVSGRLEETLSGLYRYHQEEGLQQMKTFAQVTSRGIYFVMVLVVAYLVVTYWAGYFQGVLDAY
jgi:type II secretory pathway component PulF